MSHKSVILCTFLPFIVPSVSENVSLSNEESYGQHFKLDPEVYHSWFYPEKWYKEPSQPKMKRFCALAHKMSGRGPCQVNLVLYKMRWLSFVESMHERRQIDLIEYGCQEGAEPEDIDDYWTVAVDDRWYITEGLKWDCVFYLTRENASVEFILDEHVCGIKLYGISYTLTNNT